MVPMKYTRRYTDACSSTSDGVPMATSAARANTRPSAISPAPPTRAMASEVCTVRRTPAKFCAPYCCATTTVVPEATPTNR